ncbi:hypothetical protein BJ878DRAFT_159924 [Calycina marina]|uniref:Uncharacterized protein n=1 Tax=Calycina marina TaxID=1763456 RepID=A0A9P7Z0J3_9HELO|nr:hypothetical protein BJ878DRAFT_159924 [Calycina marina]
MPHLCSVPGIAYNVDISCFLILPASVPGNAHSFISDITTLCIVSSIFSTLHHRYHRQNKIIDNRKISILTVPIFIRITGLLGIFLPSFLPYRPSPSKCPTPPLTQSQTKYSDKGSV